LTVAQPDWIYSNHALPWSRSGHLFFVKSTPTTREIWRVRSDGTDAQPVYAAEPGVSLAVLRLSPDRKRIAFISNLPADPANWSVTRKTEFWVLEGLPADGRKPGGNDD
jgi:hypothetical protein